MRNINISFLLGLLLILTSFNSLTPPQYKLRTIVIDPGHGGKDPGSVGKISYEKDVALSISLELGRIIKENLPGVKVIYTRKDDSFPSLYKRAEIANKNNADLFLSIHADSFHDKSVNGSTTYLMGLSKSNANFNVAKRENSSIFLEENFEETYKGFDPNSSESFMLLGLTQKAKIDNSTILANLIEDQLSKRVGINSRGVKQGPFQVLWNTTMPSVLIETGYMTNLEEEKKLNNKMHQVYIASAIFRAIRDYKKYLESN
jgi:N-acetylmuramoyl-L-alanine amidase